MRGSLLATATAVSLVMPLAGAEAQSEPADIPEAAADCVAELRAFNDQLVEDGYGLVGPRGYASVPTSRPTGVMPTPRGQMKTAMEAAYIFALNGQAETCNAILSGMRDLRERYGEALTELGVSPDERRDWRREWLARSVPVDEIEGVLHANEVVGADLRNLEDEDLGDIRDVVSENGDFTYALVSRGGFLGVGGEIAPVPWEALRITPMPYRDTFVLNVDEEVVAQAPTIAEPQEDRRPMAAWSEEVDSFWNEHTDG